MGSIPVEATSFDIKDLIGLNWTENWIQIPTFR